VRLFHERRSLREFVTTKMELMAIAVAATTGLRNIPATG
jgi:hypothetical protein